MTPSPLAIACCRHLAKSCMAADCASPRRGVLWVIVLWYLPGNRARRQTPTTVHSSFAGYRPKLSMFTDSRSEESYRKRGKTTLSSTRGAGGKLRAPRRAATIVRSLQRLRFYLVCILCQQKYRRVVSDTKDGKILTSWTLIRWGFLRRKPERGALRRTRGGSRGVVGRFRRCSRGRGVAIRPRALSNTTSRARGVC
jgi:hypothetical protein